MTDSIFNLGRLLLTGLIILVVLGVICFLLLGKVEGLFTSYQDERLQTINAQADADVASAREAEALARLAEARGVQEVLEASAYAVTVDATTVGFWTICGPIATATMLLMLAVAGGAVILVRLGAIEKLAGLVEARKATE